MISRRNTASKEQTSRRSDEIRRRRAGQGHAPPTQAATARNQVPKEQVSRKPYSVLGKGTASSNQARKAVPVPQAKVRRSSPNAGRTPPPVLTRSPLVGMPVRTGRPVKKARRRFDVALTGVPNAEIRLPSIPIVELSWRLVSLLLVAVLGFGVYSMWTSPKYQVQAVEISGLKRLTPAEVNAVLDVKGKPVFTLTTENMEQDLHSAFPEIITATVKMGLAPTLAVSVTERAPVLTWRYNGHTELVDADGMAFTLRNEALGGPPPLVMASALPIIEGVMVSGNPYSGTLMAATVISPELGAPWQLLPGMTVQPTRLPPAHRLLTAGMVQAVLQAAKLAPANTPLLFTGAHGLGWHDPRGWEVYLGDLEDMDQKLVVYDALLKQFNVEEIVPVLVSVEHVHAPYYRTEQ